MVQINLIKSNKSDSLDNTKSKVLSQYPFVLIIGRTGSGKTTKSLELIQEYLNTNRARWVVIFSPTSKFDKTLHTKIADICKVKKVGFNDDFDSNLSFVTFYDSLSSLTYFTNKFMEEIDELDKKIEQEESAIKNLENMIKYRISCEYKDDEFTSMDGLKSALVFRKKRLEWYDSLKADHSILFMIDDSTGDKMLGKSKGNPLFDLILARRHINASIFMPIHNYKSLIKPLRTQVNHYFLSFMSDENIKLIWQDLPVSDLRDFEEFSEKIKNLDKYEWFAV